MCCSGRALSLSMYRRFQLPRRRRWLRTARTAPEQRPGVVAKSYWPCVSIAAGSNLISKSKTLSDLASAAPSKRRGVAGGAVGALGGWFGRFRGPKNLAQQLQPLGAGPSTTLSESHLATRLTYRGSQHYVHSQSQPCPQEERLKKSTRPGRASQRCTRQSRCV